MCGINGVGLDSFEIAGFVGGQVDPNYSLPSIPRQTQFQGISLDNDNVQRGAILRAIRMDIIVALSGEGSRQRRRAKPNKAQSKAKQTKKTAQPLGAVFLHGISCSKIGNRRVRVNAALGQKQKVSGRAAAGANHAAWLGSGSGVSECVDPGLMISRANQRLLVAFHHAE